MILPVFSNVLPKMPMRTSLPFNLYTAGLVFKFLRIVYENVLFERKKIKL
jgi:hypothetical protein